MQYDAFLASKKAVSFNPLRGSKNPRSTFLAFQLKYIRNANPARVQYLDESPSTLDIVQQLTTVKRAYSSFGSIRGCRRNAASSSAARHPPFCLSFPSRATIKRQSDDGTKERQFYILAGISGHLSPNSLKPGWCSGGLLPAPSTRLSKRALLSRNESLRSFLRSIFILLPLHRAFFSSGIHFERGGLTAGWDKCLRRLVSLFIGEPAGKLTDANNASLCPSYKLRLNHFDLNTSALHARKCNERYKYYRIAVFRFHALLLLLLFCFDYQQLTLSFSLIPFRF